MKLEEAKRILTLVANGPYHGSQGAYEDQDAAAKVILTELARLENENTSLRTKMKQVRQRADQIGQPIPYVRERRKDRCQIM